MQRQQIVSRDPEVMNGALVFAGTRVPVKISRAAPCCRR